MSRRIFQTERQPGTSIHPWELDVGEILDEPALHRLDPAPLTLQRAVEREQIVRESPDDRETGLNLALAKVDFPSK
jgi:hypothetical protein